jgi:hypothetical protein
MKFSNNYRAMPGKTAAAVAIALLTAGPVSAAQVSGTIYQRIGGPANVNGTTVDRYDITLPVAAILEVDMRANESYTGSIAAPPGALVDLNGDGEYTAMDGHMRLYDGTLEVGIADDSSAYSAPGNSNGWADGSISSRDSYMLLNLGAGTYSLFVGDFNMTAADTQIQFNPGDTLANNQTKVDYALSINAFDNYDTDVNGNPIWGNPVAVSVAPVPVPAAAWLFGSALAGFGAIGRRRAAVKP